MSHYRRQQERNSSPLFSERDRHIGYLVDNNGRKFLATPKGTASYPFVERGMHRHENKAHRARAQAVERAVSNLVNIAFEALTV